VDHRRAVVNRLLRFLGSVVGCCENDNAIWGLVSGCFEQFNASLRPVAGYFEEGNAY